MTEARLVWWVVGLRVALVVAFAALFLDSIVTTVRWWRGELESPGVVEWVEIGLLPVLLGVYLRFFSVLRPDCRACDPAAEPYRSRPPS